MHIVVGRVTRLCVQEDEDNTRRDRKAPRRDSDFKLSAHQHAPDKAMLETRQKGPCSYEQCPNPYHSSGGGFKVVTNDTKAGNRDWSTFQGRVFCNACFTQYATRGTFQRPGRANNIPQTAGSAAAPTHYRDHVPPQAAAVSTPIDAYEQARARSYSPPLSQWQPAILDIPTVVEDEVTSQMQGQGEDDESEAAGVVLMLELVCDGNNVQYQWLRNGRPIPGATNSTLVIKNPGQCHGEFNCKVKNEYGQAPQFTPVQLPISLQEAKQRYEPTENAMMPEAAAYRFACTCGLVREGSPSELVEACKCGLVLCGSVDPIFSTNEQHAQA
jgi:hypothetical protein